MSPYHDKELRAIVGEKPGPDYVWCDECVRWEGGDKKHERPKICTEARKLQALARKAFSIASYFSEQATLAQATYLVKKGKGVSG